MTGRAASDAYTSEIQYVSLELAHALESAAEAGFICGRHGSADVALRVADQPDLVFVQTGEILTRRQSAAEYLAQIDLSASSGLVGVDYEDPQEVSMWRKAVENRLGVPLPYVRPM